MMRPLRLLLPPLLAFALGGCVVSMAASAAGMAAQAARGTPESNAHLQQDASAACSARASQHGRVKIIEVQQRRTDRIVVWGSVDDGTEKRSFQCDYGTRITGFKLRAIKPLR